MMGWVSASYNRGVVYIKLCHGVQKLTNQHSQINILRQNILLT